MIHVFYRSRELPLKSITSLKKSHAVLVLSTHAREIERERDRDVVDDVISHKPKSEVTGPGC